MPWTKETRIETCGTLCFDSCNWVPGSYPCISLLLCHYGFLPFHDPRQCGSLICELLMQSWHIACRVRKQWGGSAIGDGDGELLLPAVIRTWRKSKAGQHAPWQSRASLPPCPGPVTYPLAFVTSSGMAHWERSNLTYLHDTQLRPFFSSLIKLIEETSWLWSFYDLVKSKAQFSLKYSWT